MKKKFLYCMLVLVFSLSIFMVPFGMANAEVPILEEPIDEIILSEYSLSDLFSMAATSTNASNYPATASRCNNDYSGIDSTSNVYARADGSYQINTEKYRLLGIDDNETDIFTLTPNNSSWNAPASYISTTGPITVYFLPELGNPPSGSGLSDDTVKLKDLTTNLRISGSNTTISYGRAFVRSRKIGGTSWSGWTTYGLSNANWQPQSVRIWKNCEVQIVVCQEFRDYLSGASNIYYPVRSIYRINVTGCSVSL